MSVFLGTVSTIEDRDAEGRPASARVLPATEDGIVTLPFAVHWSMRAGEGALAVGDTVVCLRFDDGGGLVLCRPDGTWTGTVGGDLAAEGGIAASGDVSAEGDVSAAGTSLKSHKHMGVHGTTGVPIG